MMKTPLVYLAGKINGRKHAIAKDVGGAAFMCSDGSNHSEHDFGFSYYRFSECNHGKSLREAVTEHSIRLLHNVDMVFAYLDDPTSFGSIAEIAYASALGKPVVICVLCPPEPEGEDLEVGDELPPPSMYDRLFDAYWFVSCFPRVHVFEVMIEEQAVQICQAAVHGLANGAFEPQYLAAAIQQR